MSTIPYEPSLYAPERLAEVLPNPSAVDDAAVERYLADGYLAVASVFDADEVVAEVERVEALAAGDMAQLDEGVNPTGPDAAASDRVRKLCVSPAESREVGMPVDHAGLMGVVQRLMGGRVPRLYQAMALLKPPRGGGEKPWHQDHAYFNVPVGQRIVGVWIALDAATVANGCMQLLPGQHHDGPVVHFKRRDWQMCDTEVLGQASVAAELEPGGALFFDSLLPHGTPMNTSTERRRALQFHYAPVDAPDWTVEQRLAVFGSEGRDVEC
ncbi:MAG: phytanoyl-CoA dioxygenase family protein [Planctomycetota bacterium]